MKRTVGLLVVMMAGSAWAQDAAPQPAEPPVSVPPSAGTHEPTLDELLGLPNATREPAKLPTDVAKKDLERALSTREVDEAFEQAVGLMQDVSERLTKSKDAGLDTQRAQQEILTKLDTLIDAAQQNQQQQKQRSRSQQQQQQQQEQQQQGSQAGQQQANSNQGGDPNVPLQQGALKPAPAGSAASWGNLPEYLRNSLTQGRSDRFSSLYQQLTERYYKRLAQERHQEPRP